MTQEKFRVVFDINVFINAAMSNPDSLLDWPVSPQRSGSTSADCLGAVNDAREFELYVSEHILTHVETILANKYGWDLEDAMDYTDLISEIAAESGGGYREKTFSSEYCKDEEDRKILSLASDVDAHIIVSEDGDLTELSPWKGKPIQTSREFSDKLASKRRTEPKLGPPSTTDKIKAEPNAPTLSERLAYLAEKAKNSPVHSGPQY